MPITKLSKYFFSRNLSLLIAGALFFISAGVLNLRFEKPVIELSKQDTALNINNDLLIFMSAGNKRLLTDLLWVQTLIESDIEHYGKKDLNNWLFLRFNSISSLDPLFYENYLYGGQFLAIVKDDLEGANYIYKKGLGFYPDDYRLNYQAAFLNYYEIGDYEKGIEYLKKIENHPKAPVFIRSIINKLLFATGVELSEVYKLVYHNYATEKDPTLKAKLNRDLYAIKAELDLKCLNNKGSNCSDLDFDQVPYIRKGDQYYTYKYFLRYRINRKEETKVSSDKKSINYLR